MRTSSIPLHHCETTWHKFYTACIGYPLIGWTVNVTVTVNASIKVDVISKSQSYCRLYSATMTIAKTCNVCGPLDSKSTDLLIAYIHHERTRYFIRRTTSVKESSCYLRKRSHAKIVWTWKYLTKFFGNSYWNSYWSLIENKNSTVIQQEQC